LLISAIKIIVPVAGSIPQIKPFQLKNVLLQNAAIYRRQHQNSVMTVKNILAKESKTWIKGTVQNIGQVSLRIWQ
jgi:hypothetical protein